MCNLVYATFADGLVPDADSLERLDQMLLATLSPARAEAERRVAMVVAGRMG